MALPRTQPQPLMVPPFFALWAARFSQRELRSLSRTPIIRETAFALLFKLFLSFTDNPIKPQITGEKRLRGFLWKVWWNVFKMTPESLGEFSLRRILCCPCLTLDSVVVWQKSSRESNTVPEICGCRQFQHFSCGASLVTFPKPEINSLVFGTFRLRKFSSHQWVKAGRT